MHHSLMQHISSAYENIRARNPQSGWDRQLQAGEPWRPRDGSLLVVGPHPHDEILGAGGLIHTWVSMGQDVTVLSVTDGEADDEPAEHFDLLRRDELRAALRKLCATHVSVVRLGLPDGHVADAQNRLRMAIDALLEPQMTLIAPYEFDGHPDHDAVGKVCRQSAQVNGVPLARYLLRPWVTNPSRFVDDDLSWGKFPLDMEARRAKSHALQCFSAKRATNAAARIDPFQRPFEAFLL
jgi:LmbE family N-acetylglucosaminyl deacetylase